MDIEYAKIYVSIMLDHIVDLMHKHTFGVNHAEYIFLQIWQVLSTHPDLKNWFMSKVEKSILQDGSLDYIDFKKTIRPEWFIDDDLICFIAHLSRWDEFAELAQRRRDYLIKENKLRPGSRDISDEILHALQDDWEDKEFYSVFNSGH